MLLGVAALALTAEVPAQETSGNAERGETLFTSGYKCYACHGFDAQTGQRRLTPMKYTQEAFTAFVQNSPLTQMPAYPDASDSELADIYAYILTIPMDAPAVEDVALLRDILENKLRQFEN